MRGVVLYVYCCWNIFEITSLECWHVIWGLYLKRGKAPMTGFRVASDWWRGGCEFPRPLTETVNSQGNQKKFTWLLSIPNWKLFTLAMLYLQILPSLLTPQYTKFCVLVYLSFGFFFIVALKLFALIRYFTWISSNVKESTRTKPLQRNLSMQHEKV